MTKSNTQFVKFVASTTSVNLDVDIIVADIRTMGVDAIMYFVNEALDSPNPKEIVYVVDEDMGLAENTAQLLNNKYNEEVNLIQEAKNMNKKDVKKEVLEQAKKEVNDAIEGTVRIEEEDQAAVIAKSAAAKKFLSKHGGALMNAKKGENKSTKSEEEKEMNKTVKEEVKGARRRLSTTGKGTESKENKSTKNVKEEKEMNKTTEGTKGASRRLSAGRKTAADHTEKKREQGRRRLGRSASLKSEYKKFEGPWYLDAKRFPVLDRFEDIVATMRDDELGIGEIVLVDPTETRRYKNRDDLLMVVQVLANGNILEFPIKEQDYENNPADLKASTISWVKGYNGKGGRYQFGQWKSSSPEMKVTCTCGNEFRAPANNVYCPKCRTRHDDIIISAEHSELEFDFTEMTFHVNDSLTVPEETLALVMAIAQYDEGLDMHGVIEDDGEEA